MGERETRLAIPLNQPAPQAWLHLAQGMLEWMGKDSSPTTTVVLGEAPPWAQMGSISVSHRPSLAVAS